VSATFSEDRRYRYTLVRRWDDRLPSVMFVGLNPSTADETLDDPTIRRCIGFAKSWGYGALVMTNLFAFRSTDPRAMASADDPIGNPFNDVSIERIAQLVDLTVVAWGSYGDRAPARVGQVLALIGDVYCLGVTKSGQPRHPLYLRRDAALESHSS
jgi:hypothetical protein